MIPEQSPYPGHQPDMFLYSPPISPPLSETDFVYIEESNTTDHPLAYNIYQRILDVAEREKQPIDEELKRQILLAAFTGPALHYQH